MCVHLCNCKSDDLILMVSLDFKTSWKMFTQRGKYVVWMFLGDNIGSFGCKQNFIRSVNLTGFLSNNATF